jgi:UPF0755 protein
LAALILGVAGAAGLVAWWLQQPLPLAGPSAELSIEPGTSPRDVAQAWVDAGVQTSPALLYQLFKWSGQAPRIRAGSYEIEAGTSPRRLLAKMVQGEETLERVRFIEGWTLRQLRAALAKAPNLKPLTSGMADAQLMAAVGAPGVPAEGRFFPDTYIYSRGVSDLTVLKRAYQAMQRRLASVWSEKPADSPLKTMDEALILASIIEKETGAAADRALVAGVFINRLRLGMPLQTDPTAICASATCWPTRPTTPTPAVACRPRRYRCRGWPRCAPPCGPSPRRRCISWPAATAPAPSATTWPTIIAR